MILQMIIFQSGYPVGRQAEEIMIMKGEGLGQKPHSGYLGCRQTKEVVFFLS